jgi:DNA-binding SARP family transcriptional activator
VEYGLLGPIEARRDGAVVALGGGRPRALLALLALHANEVVPAERLIDGLWGEAPPPTAAKALQVHVRSLRRALGDDAIVTRNPGYLLPVAEDGLDVDRFERLAAGGREALAAGDAHGAALALERALALWRGPALADVAYEAFAQAPAQALEEARVAAMEDLADALLAADRVNDALPVLERLVSGHPLRERARRTLMLALYRAGRQADALAAYRAARETLVAELGLEPSAQLRALHQAILEEDPSLGSPAPAPARPGGAPRLGTVLAVAVEALDQVALDRASALAGMEVERAGGRIAGGPGPLLLAGFGTERALEDHARRAFAAAHAAIERVAVELEGAASLRAGVETGEVVTDADGLLSGTPVSVAVRLAAGADEEVVAAGPRAGAGRAARPALRRAFVGRAAELEMLDAVVSRVSAGRAPHWVAVTGEAGVGKSALVRALRDRIPRGVAFEIARCAQSERGAPYRPLGRLVRARLGIEPDEPPEDVAAALGRRPGLELLLGLEPPGGLHPLDARARLHEAWLDLLAERTDHAPLVLVVEDLHWAEEPLLELLDTSVREADGPLALVTTARPEAERRPAAPNMTHMRLEPLPPDDARAMVDAVAPGLPPEAVEVVLGRAEGNPFFAEEAIGALVDRGALVGRDGAWVLAGDVPEHLDATDSVQSVLAARIDLLPEHARRALQAAAVAGRTFGADALEHLAARSGAALRLLEERDFVRRRRGGERAAREYAFKHALTREVAYGTLPAADRASLHGSFAEWLERTHGGRDEDAAVLARHYADAVPGGGERMRAKAIRWLRRAAQLSVTGYDIDAGLALLHEALALETSRAGRVELWLEVGWACRARFDTDNYRVAVEQALELDPPEAVVAEIMGELAYAGTQSWLWREPPAEDVGRRWTARALEVTRPGTVARGLALCGLSNLDPGANVAAADEAVAIAERLDDSMLRQRAFQCRSEGARDLGALDEACDWGRRSIPAEGSCDPFHLEGGLFSFGITLLRVGAFAEARDVAARHAALCRRLAPHQRIHAVALDLLVDVLAGRWPEAFAQAERTTAACAENRDTPCQFNWRSCAYVALAAEASGDRTAARRMERAAAEEPQVGGSPATEGALIRLALLRGNLRRVEDMVAERPQINRFGDLGYAAARMDALLALGDVRRVEEEAPPLIDIGGYDGAFALRALGEIRRDDRLRAAAGQAFARMGLDGRLALPA